MASTSADPGVVRSALSGAGVFATGLRLWVTSPRLMLLGAVPALIVGTVILAGLIVLATRLVPLAEAATAFAGQWDQPWLTTIRVVAGVAIAAAGLLIAVYLFTALTLIVGDPFYERISREVERRLGGIDDEVETPFWAGIRRSIAEAIVVLLLTTGFGVLVFAAGFIPVLGQTLVPVCAALVGGWFLALELSGFAMSARGLRLGERRRLLAARRSRSVGFGVAVYLLFLIPGGAVIGMPSAVAGATVLARSALGAPTTPRIPPQTPPA